MVLREVFKGFHPVLYPSCVAEDAGSGELFQDWIDRNYPRLQLRRVQGVLGEGPLISSPSERPAS